MNSSHSSGISELAPTTFTKLHQRPNYFLWAVLVILLIIVLIPIVIYRHPITTFVKNLNALTQIHGDYLVTGPADGTTVEKIGYFKNTPITSKSGKLVDYARVPSGEFAIVLSATGRDEDIVKLGATEKKLTTDGGIKSALTVSPDGNYIAYAQLLPGTYGVSGPSTRLQDWYVSLYDVKGKTVSRISNAYQPQFFTKEGKLYMEFMNARGMGMTNVASNTTRILSDLTSESTAHPTYVSPDGKYAVKFNTVKDGEYALYSIGGTYPFALKKEGVLPTSQTHIIGITNSGLYAVNPSKDTSSIQHIPFASLSAQDWTYLVYGTDIIKLNQ